MSVVIDEQCTACGLCLLTCPDGALSPAPRRPAVADDACTDCWLCLEVCPVDAITPEPAQDRTKPADPAGARSSRR